MSYYTNSAGEVKQIDDATVAAWVAANNPKASSYTKLPDPPGPGAQWNGSEWVLPPPYVPQVVSRFQAKAALLQAGLLSQVEALIADPNTDAVTKLAWAEAIEFYRNSPTILTLSTALGLTSQQVDDLFTTAANISA